MAIVVIVVDIEVVMIVMTTGGLQGTLLTVGVGNTLQGTLHMVGGQGGAGPDHLITHIVAEGDDAVGGFFTQWRTAVDVLVGSSHNGGLQWM
uniref:Uncharacterized protein n=1 Tax=Rhizophora mucronata TaxID=61149 RepID=A0A2P2L5E3_RHIMU